MSAANKLGTYAVILAVVLGGGAAVGSAAGPIDVGGDDDHDSGHADDGTGAAELPAGGLMVSQDGYTLEADDRLADGGEFGFRIVGPDGNPVVDYDERHDRELHLIVASRDLQTFHHVHPELDASGRWSIALPALAPGAYRAFADFQPSGGEPLTLGVDLVAPGEVGPPAPLHHQRTDDLGDLEVSVDGTITAGAASEVTVTVRRDGDVVTTEPYLGAAGHLVALRDGDLAYLHVHPLDDEPNGPVRFAVEAPSAATYALFFDFLVDGELHTARFVLDATGGDRPDDEAPSDDHAPTEGQ